MPFLTDLDERAEVKGSRDPLGLVPLWSKLGREVVGNLTTVTNSVRGFTTLLVGLELAEIIRDELRGDAPPALDVFLRVEQLAGYARYRMHGGSDIRGYRRVARRLNESRRIRISAATEHQILSNQKIYGLWGLFTVASRASGLLEPGEARLHPDARAFVERHYFPYLGNGRGVKALVDRLRRSSFDIQTDGRDAGLLDGLGRMHEPRLRKDESVFYRDHLAWGGPRDSTSGKQRVLAELLACITTPEFGFPEFKALQKAAHRNEDLASPLQRIGWVEALIAPASLLFGFLQTRHRQSMDSVARELAVTWERPLRLDLGGLGSLEDAIAAALQSPPEAALWMELADALSRSTYRRAIELLIAINASVMRRRHGAAPWITTERGMIQVHLADEGTKLLPVAEAEEHWRSTYFINSLWRIAREVQA
jgi:hypothetical protein